MTVENKINPSPIIVEKSLANVEPIELIKDGKTSVLSTGVYGIVKWYNCKFNYGFICRLDNKQDLFVHRNGIKRCNPRRYKSLADGEVVQFDVHNTEKGIEATNVTGPEGKPARASRFAKYRPWYLEIMKKTRDLKVTESFDASKKEDFRKEGSVRSQRYNSYKQKDFSHVSKEIRNKEKSEKTEKNDKIVTEKSSSAAQTSSNPRTSGSSSDSVHEAKAVDTDVGYSSKSPSENNDATKNNNGKYRKYKRSPRDFQKKYNSHVSAHACTVCDKMKTPVEA